MGYYYDFEIKVKLKKDSPQVAKLIEFAVTSDIADKENHPFFRLSRWDTLLGQLKLDPATGNLKGEGTINYGIEELFCFFSWIESALRPTRKKRLYLGRFKGEDSESCAYYVHLEKMPFLKNLKLFKADQSEGYEIMVTDHKLNVTDSNPLSFWKWE